jgi:hypothetical protein
MTRQRKHIRRSKYGRKFRAGRQWIEEDRFSNNYRAKKYAARLKYNFNVKTKIRKKDGAYRVYGLIE